MKLTDFAYDYPKAAIAKYPAEPREAARLMVIDRHARTVEHRTVADLPDYFGPGDVIVGNDTAVFPARLYGRKEKTGAKIEVFLLRELNAETRLWDVIVDPARKIRVGNKLYFEGDLVAEVIDNTTSRGRTIRFCFEGTPQELYDLIDRHGTTPIPHYCRRPAEPEDRDRYQSPFAKHRGAVAAPAACLHFSDTLLAGLADTGVDVCTVTLHTGLGTFRPVEVEDLSKHRMDVEYFAVPPETATAVNRALSSPTNSVTIASTTSVRAVESSLSAMRQLKSGQGWTDKFIYPPYDFLITERLLTNFHMPRSTLLMLASAFCGHELLMQAYEEALRENYRLFAFGDAMLIL
ncbi:MAG: tRNA preQ1(34) S-adenosylmethionine ribosyltransferase-isomerase QueA [Bacteroidota bacterium]